MPSLDNLRERIEEYLSLTDQALDQIGKATTNEEREKLIALAKQNLKLAIEGLGNYF
jgi:hypothetical protein